MEPKSVLIETLGDYPKIRIIDFLIISRMFDYSTTEIAKNSNVHYVTFKKIWTEMIKNKAVVKTRKVGNSNLYKINEKSFAIQKIIEIGNHLAKQGAEEALKEHNRKKKLIIKTKIK